MAKRELKKLDPRTVATISTPGRYSDGGGLYLLVGQSGAKSWAFLFRWNGKLKEMGLGSFTAVGLARAREKATEARGQVADGVNPIEARKALKAVPTFGEFADELVETLKAEWRNEKHKAQWSMTLKIYAKPLRGLKINEIRTEAVLEVLTPLWSTRHETASRLRGRIERVLDAARARGFIRSPWENPARWRGHLDKLLPRRRKLTRGHQRALPFARMPDFMGRLRERQAMAALALEFAILTAARTSEVVFATWVEVDLDAAVWTVPAARMKAGREHRVPLSKAAIAVLEKVALGTNRPPDGWVFPGGRKDRPLSTNAFRALLLRMGDPATAHGFRSSFRTWASESSSFPSELAEAALAHVVGDETERAYRRTDVLERRRKLMDAWARYCATVPGSNVKPFGRVTA